MQIEVLTEKLTNGKQSAFIDYGEEAISVDIGDGRDMIPVEFSNVDALIVILQEVRRRIDGCFV